MDFCVPKNELPSWYKFVRCILILTWPKDLNKSEGPVYAFLYIIERTIERTCTSALHMLKYISGAPGVHDEAVDIRASPLCMFVTVLKLKGCALKLLRYTQASSPSIKTHLAVVRGFPTKKFQTKCVKENSSTERRI